MTTKEKLLQLLASDPGAYFSGEEMAGQLGVSRTAVWKAVKALQAQGCAIDAVTNRGYRLKGNVDLLSPGDIETGDFWHITALPQVDSTNSALRDRANAGAPEGTVLIAEAQTGGRGRMGRQFYSPNRTGLYLSFLLRPVDFTPDQALQLTTMAASALCLAIRQVTGIRVGIKWVNDLLLDGKKICGILTEAAFNLETARLDYAVVGLGLNLCPPEGGFPAELRSIAGSLLKAPEAGLKNRLVSAFLGQFLDFYQNRRFAEAARVYREHCAVIGKTVLAQGRQARVLDVTDRCQLLVRFEDGETRALSYGEVSIVNL